MSAPAPDDSKILTLFREWVAATRAAVALYGDDGESEEYKTAAAAVDDKIERAIIETPSSGAAGLAIKAYLAMHAKGGGVEDAAELSPEFALDWEIDASILKDVIRFVPELAPLVAGALAAVDEGVGA